MKAFLVVAALMVVVGCGALLSMALNGDGSDGYVMPVEQAAPKPKPTLTTTELRSEKVGDDRYRVWPRSEDVPNDGTYRFTTPHCGLDWMIDFDASFWQIVDRPGYGKDIPYFFIGTDRGTMTFGGNGNDVIYESSKGVKVPLVRLPGGIVIDLCM